MLSRLLKDHQAKQNERKELQEKRRKDAVAAATCLTEALVDHLNVGWVFALSVIENKKKQKTFILCPVLQNL
ncbi:hypothetical protein scyTo_0016890 [Scyliorhinus torazame]|uniref:Biogenesis of lysosome-related organelles complex 1 subunit 1 n=1 Tax=Scyliorhinus torazame TaxID=75743 RepID=A0A401Q0N0_SCYTO|nr:hypothetical protein [Scyliorhinus torazame]